MLNCREINEFSPGDTLWRQWKELQQRVRPEQALFGPEWYSIWLQTHGSDARWTGRPRLLVVTDEHSSLKGIMVLSEQRYAGVRVPASAGYYQPWRIILADRFYKVGVGQALGQFLMRSGWLVSQLGPYRRSSPLTSALMEELTSQHAGVVVRGSSPLAVASVPANWEDYKRDVLTGKFYRKIGYYERKMSQAGSVKREHFRQPDPETTRKLISDLSQIEQRSWLVKTSRGKTRFSTEVAQQFWTRLIDEALAPNDQFDAWVISLDNRPVSFCVTMTSSTTRYVIANQYDESVADFRTGSTLYRDMIEEGISRGIRSFDFGDGGIDYKKLWGAEYVDHLDTVMVAPHLVTSRLLTWGDRAIQWMKNRRSKHIVDRGPLGSNEVQQCLGAQSIQVEKTLVESDLLNEVHSLIGELDSIKETQPASSAINERSKKAHDEQLLCQ